MSTFPVAMHRPKTNLLVPVIVFFVGVALAFALALATGWGSSTTEDRPERISRSTSSVDQKLDCRIGRAC